MVIKIAVPVCPIRFNDNVIGLCATSLNVPGKLKFNTKLDNLPLGKNKFLNDGALQIITMIVKMTNGLHAYNIDLALWCFTGSGFTSFEL